MNFFFNPHTIDVEQLRKEQEKLRQHKTQEGIAGTMHNGIFTLDGKDLVKEIRVEDEWPENILNGFEITRQAGPLVTVSSLSHDPVYAKFYYRRKTT